MANKKNAKNNLPGAGPGRPPGCKNKITTNLKELVLDTVKQLEKENKSLAEEGRKDPKWFYANFVKPMLPKDVDLTVGGDLTVIIKQLGDDKTK
jgi:hypothetical protein